LALDRNMPTHPRRVQAAERQARALEMRLGHKSFREIGRELGVAHTVAREYVVKALEETRHKIREEAETLRTEEMARMEVASDAVWVRVLEGDLRAIETWLKIRARWAALGGVDKAVPRAVAPEEEASAGGWSTPPTATPEEVEVLRRVVGKIKAVWEGTPVQVTDDQGRPVRAELLPEGE